MPAGTTNHIEFLLGGNHTITKTGAGCLEIGIVTNTGVSIAVSGGTLAFSDPRTLTTTGTLFHVDASLASSLVTVTENGTNFVTRWNDAEGGAYYATYDTARPRPMLAVNHAAGLDMIDFGQLYYSSDKGAAHADGTRDSLDAATQAILKSGYGAAFNISAQISGVKDYVYVLQDREESKDLIAATTMADAAAGATGLRLFSFIGACTAARRLTTFLTAAGRVSIHYRHARRRNRSTCSTIRRILHFHSVPSGAASRMAACASAR